MVNAIVSPQQGVLGGSFMQLAELQPNQGRWDSFRLAAGAILNTYDYFAVPEGQAGSGYARAKTYRETNMQTGGKLGAGINGNVKLIYVTATPVGGASTAAATNDYIMSFLEDSVLEFTVNDNEVIGPRMPVRYGGYGIDGFADQTGVADVSIASTSATNRMKAYRLRKPVGIPSNTGFRVSIRPNANNTFLNAGVPVGGEFVQTIYLFGTFGSIAVN